MEWDVEMRVTDALAMVMVEADSEEEALIKAQERGVELRDIVEVSDAVAVVATRA